MFDFHEKRKIKNVLYSRVVIGVLFLIALFLSFSVYDRYVVAEEMRMKLETKRTELVDLKKRAAAIESKVSYMKDDRGVEEELRNRFDVARAGEKVVVLLDEKGETPQEQGTTTDTSPIPPSDEGIMIRIARFFKFW